MPAPFTPPLLQVEGLSLTYPWEGRPLEVLSGIGLALDKGEIAAIVGPSGSGKSSFFNALTGLLPYQSGRIRLNGADLPHLRGHAAYMQQKDLLLPWRTTLDNAILGLEIQGMPRPAARDRARRLFQEFGLAGFENTYPDELSGGMRQRAALMRTILCHRDILLLDEPFGALDAITRRSMQTWLLSVWDRIRASVILITHDVEEALLLADRVYVWSAPPATVRAVLEVPMARPRRAADPDLVALKERLLDLLAPAAEARV